MTNRWTPKRQTEGAHRFLSWLGGGSTSLALGSLSVVLLVCVARMLGLWEAVELQTLDFLLRHRPLEPVDERVTILEITDADLQALGTYPVPDDALLALLNKLESYNPSVIGLDIFRDLPVVNPVEADLARSQQANAALLNLLQTAPNVVVIEKILDPPIVAPAGVPWQNIGFADALLDSDGFVRRSLLASPSNADPDDYHLSFTIQLAAKYLATQGFELENGLADPDAMRFGDTELFRMRATSGGYQYQDTGDNPVLLLSFRQHPEPFRRISFTQFMAGEVPPDWIKDRVVLVGMTAVSTKDYVNSAALAAPFRRRGTSQNPGLVPGVELQAHAVSQILSAVLDGRPLLRTWQTPWEYLWIVGCGLAGLGLVHYKRRLVKGAVVFIGLGLVPVVLSYGLLLVGIWIPLFPAWVAYAATGGGVLVYRLHQYEQVRKIRARERQRILERSYSAIHNGPLQTLKGLIRQVSSQDFLASQAAAGDDPTEISRQLQVWTSELSQVDGELRNIYEFMQRESLQQGASSETQIYLTQNYVIDLTGPLHELLHQVYQNKLQESGLYFETIKVKISDFGPMAATWLSAGDREKVLRFFEEALCNIEQHAVGVTRLKIVCKQEGQKNVVRVTDNGTAGVVAANRLDTQGGEGSRQAAVLARRLGGHFRRYARTPKGTVCELVWPVQPLPIWKTWLHWPA
ncbi:MAG: CHASE2 domain-containing protein [Cyanobacteria bacterium J06598_1]